MFRKINITKSFFGVVYSSTESFVSPYVSRRVSFSVSKTLFLNNIYKNCTIYCVTSIAENLQKLYFI